MITVRSLNNALNSMRNIYDFDGEKCCSIAFKNWLDSEYVAPKTKTEKFCETLKAGEVIAVSDTDENLTTNFIYIRFNKYDKEMDKIRTSGFFKNPSWSWNYGRKLTAEER